MPGGAVYVNEYYPVSLDLTNYCVSATLNIIRIAEKLHTKGIDLPIWGTCLGFQLLVLYTTNMSEKAYGTDVRDKCESMDYFLSVEFLPGNQLIKVIIIGTRLKNCTSIINNLVLDLPIRLYIAGFPEVIRCYAIFEILVQEPSLCVS